MTVAILLSVHLWNSSAVDGTIPDVNNTTARKQLTKL